jgi:ABC-type glycerol-3-phosphate transport system substrate-binding protein
MSIEGKKSWFKKNLPLIVIMLMLALAVWNIIQRNSRDNGVLGSSKIIKIRICDSNPASLQALLELAKNYETIYNRKIDNENKEIEKYNLRYPKQPKQKKKKIKLLIESIPKKFYLPFTYDQLINKQAPDLLQIDNLFDDRCLCRYFYPLSEELSTPNPYNSNDLEMKYISWMDTFRKPFTPCSENGEFYSASLSCSTFRIMYNRDLFKEATGSITPPANTEELLRVCAKLKDYYLNKKSASERAPFSCSRKHVEIISKHYLDTFVAWKCLKIDQNCNGIPGPEDVLFGFVSGIFKLDAPEFKELLTFIKKLATYFPADFWNLSNDDAELFFIKGQAAMLITNSRKAVELTQRINDRPFGDVILKVNGKPVTNASEAETELGNAVKKHRSIVRLLIKREKHSMELTLKPKKGDDLWTSYGIKLKDIKGYKKIRVPVITEIAASSPAAKAGLIHRERFQIDVFDFPKPATGQYAGPGNGVFNYSFRFAVPLESPNHTAAIDFLHFCTNPENNQLLNKIANKLPSVQKAKAEGILKNFQPEGNSSVYTVNLDIGDVSSKMLAEKFKAFIDDKLTLDLYLKYLKKYLPECFAIDYLNLLRKNNEILKDKQIERTYLLANYFLNDSRKSRDQSARKLSHLWGIILNLRFRKHELEKILDTANLKTQKGTFAEKFLESIERRKAE